jgi:hypothetical protein
MKSVHPIEEYCQELLAFLPAGTLRSTRVVYEASSHLDEIAEDFREQGMSTTDAEREAIRQFGTAAEVASAFSQEAPLEPEFEPMIRKAFTVLVALTSLFAAALIVFTVLGKDDYFWWTATKLIVGLFVVLQGQLALFVLRSPYLRGDLPRLVMFLSGLATVAVGAAGGAWSAHLGLVTGDWDGYAGAGAIMLCLQGAASTWLARPNLPAPRAAMS